MHLIVFSVVEGHSKVKSGAKSNDIDNRFLHYTILQFLKLSFRLSLEPCSQWCSFYMSGHVICNLINLFHILARWNLSPLVPVQCQSVFVPLYRWLLSLLLWTSWGHGPVNLDIINADSCVQFNYEFELLGRHAVFEEASFQAGFSQFPWCSLLCISPCHLPHRQSLADRTTDLSGFQLILRLTQILFEYVFSNAIGFHYSLNFLWCAFHIQNMHCRCNRRRPTMKRDGGRFDLARIWERLISSQNYITVNVTRLHR